MIVDAILNRRDALRSGEKDRWTSADVRYLLDEAGIFGFDYIAEAIASGDEDAVREALCQYIDEQEYDSKLKRFVQIKSWLA